MPRGPKGEKRHADTIQNAMLIGRIATGDIENTTGIAPNRAKGGKVGGAARAAELSPVQRQEIVRKATKTRWNLCSTPVYA